MICNKEDIKVELIKHPTEADWVWVKNCTLNTVGKRLKTKTVDEQWKRKLLASEHSPIRELWFGVRMYIPYWVSVHFVRHHIGVNHYVQSQRDDRVARDEEVTRMELPQGEMVCHVMSVNAATLMYIMRKRLCYQASPETRYVAELIKQEVIKTNPEFEEFLVPLCIYRNGKCTEMFPCGKYVWSKSN